MPPVLNCTLQLNPKIAKRSAKTLVNPTLALGDFPPPKVPKGHDPPPSEHLITPRKIGHKMNLF